MAKISLDTPISELIPGAGKYAFSYVGIVTLGNLADTIQRYGLYVEQKHIWLKTSFDRSPSGVGKKIWEIVLSALEECGFDWKQYQNRPAAPEGLSVLDEEILMEIRKLNALLEKYIELKGRKDNETA